MSWRNYHRSDTEPDGGAAGRARVKAARDLEKQGGGNLGCIVILLVIGLTLCFSIACLGSAYVEVPPPIAVTPASTSTPTSTLSLTADPTPPVCEPAANWQEMVRSTAPLSVSIDLDAAVNQVGRLVMRNSCAISAIDTDTEHGANSLLLTDVEGTLWLVYYVDATWYFVPADVYGEGDVGR